MMNKVIANKKTNIDPFLIKGPENLSPEALKHLLINDYLNFIRGFMVSIQIEATNKTKTGSSPLHITSFTDAYVPVFKINIQELEEAIDTCPEDTKFRIEAINNHAKNINELIKKIRRMDKIPVKILNKLEESLLIMSFFCYGSSRFEISINNLFKKLKSREP